MAHSAHEAMENLSYPMLIAAVAGTGLYGYYAADPAARRDPLTGVEAAGLGVAINELVERATERQRPFQMRSATAFFAGGKSFTAQDAVIQSALAAGTSTYYGDKWYVAVHALLTRTARGLYADLQQLAMVLRRQRRWFLGSCEQCCDY